MMAEPSPSTARTPSLVRSVVTNWIWYGFVMISGFLLPRFIDRAHGQELLGVWDFGWSLVIYVSMLALGVQSAVNPAVARCRATADWKQLNVAVCACLGLLTFSLAGGLLMTAGLCVALPMVLMDASPEQVAIGRWVMALLGLSACLRFPGNVFNGIITGYQRFDLLNVIRVARDVGVLGGCLALIYAGYGLVALATLVLIGDFLAGFAKLLLAQRLCPQLEISPRHIELRAMRNMVGFGGKTILQSLAASAHYQLSSIFVGIFLGPAVLAVFARQRALVMHLLRFTRQYAQVLIPSGSDLAARGRDEELRQLLVKTSRYGFYLVTPIVAIFVIMGGPLLNLWMGPDYEAPLTLAILALGHLASASQHGAYSLLMGVDKHGYPALFELLAAIGGALIGLLLLIGTDLGMCGVAIGVTVGVAAAAGILTPYYACRRFGLSYTYYLRGVLAGPAIAALPMIACLLAARMYWADAPQMALLIGVLAGGLGAAPFYWRWGMPDSIRAKVLALIGHGRPRHPSAGANAP